MALTLSEWEKLSNDVLLQGVVETIVKDSPTLQVLPFIDIVGNGLTYNVENALMAAAWHAPGDAWAGADENLPLGAQKTATLTILGGDADVDRFIQQTRSNIQDIEAATVELKAKALRHAWEDCFINGDGLNNKFEGIDKLCQTSAQTVDGAGNALNLDQIDELVDLVKGGKPNILLMSRRTRRDLNKLMRATGSGVEVGQDEFGNFVEYYDGIRVGINDWISDTQEYGASSVYSSIFAFQVGEGGLCGCHNGGIQVEHIGALEGKDATRIRLKWYVSLCLFSTVKAARYTAIAKIA